MNTWLEAIREIHLNAHVNYLPVSGEIVQVTNFVYAILYTLQIF